MSSPLSSSAFGGSNSCAADFSAASNSYYLSQKILRRKGKSGGVRKTAVLSVILLTGLSPLYAATESTPAPKRSTSDEKKISEMRKRIEEKKTELNGSSWEVMLDSSSDPRMKGEKDTLTFQNGRFSSKNLTKRGFNPTNYTISLPAEDSETAVWETMQTGKDGLIFIRGEWEKDKMKGDISEQLEGGKRVKEYYFTTVSRVNISPTSSKEAGDSDSSKEDVTSSNEKGNNNTEPSILVSKEETVPNTVASFNPGTTEEITTETGQSGAKSGGFAKKTK